MSIIIELLLIYAILFYLNMTNLFITLACLYIVIGIIRWSLLAAVNRTISKLADSLNTKKKKKKDVEGVWVK